MRVNVNRQLRRANVLGEDTDIQVLANVRANPRVSTRRVSFEIGISHNSVHNI